MPDLREQLARRLGYVYRLTHGWSEPEVHWGDRLLKDDVTTHHNQTAEMVTWLKVADECIRQMEWARRRGMFTEEKIGEPVSAMSLGFPSPAVFGPTIKRTAIGLTLAPDDWTPNKET